MKILLIGEYSNVHATLATGLRALGHQVTVISNGDFWKNYPRDIDVSRQSGKWGGIKLMVKLWTLLPKIRGYDVVQLINPMFFELKAERLEWFYKYLKRHNKRIVLGAYGMDYYWVSTCCNEMPLRYSDFNIGHELRTNEDALKEKRDWIGTAKERLNRLIAENCNGIVTGLYEYFVCYKPKFTDKTCYIPFPIKMPEICEGLYRYQQESLGIQRHRHHAESCRRCGTTIPRQDGAGKGRRCTFRAVPIHDGQL